MYFVGTYSQDIKKKVLSCFVLFTYFNFQIFRIFTSIIWLKRFKFMILDT